MLRLGLALAVLLVSLASAVAAAAPPSQAPVVVEASADRDRATVGDRITLTVVVRLAPGVQVELPATPTVLGDLEVLDAPPPQDILATDGSREVRLTYVVAAFRTGPLSLAPPPIAYTTGDGAKSEAAAAPIAIQVASVLPAGQPPSDIRDLKPQLALPGEAATPLWPIGAGLGAAALGLATAWLALRLRRRARTRPRREPAPATPSLEELALAELELIAARELVGGGDYKGFYASVAGCIRRYLTERYRFSAAAMSTSELEAEMTKHGVDHWQARLVVGLLAECDAVVYARYLPAAARVETSLAMAYEVLQLGAPSGEALPVGSGAQ